MEGGLGQPKTLAWPWCKLQVIRRGKLFLDQIHNEDASALARLSDQAYLMDGKVVAVRLKASNVLGQEMHLVDMEISKEEATESRIQHQINYDTDECCSDFEDCPPREWKDPGITIQVDSHPQSPSFW